MSILLLVTSVKSKNHKINIMNSNRIRQQLFIPTISHNKLQVYVSHTTMRPKLPYDETWEKNIMFIGPYIIFIVE